MRLTLAEPGIDDLYTFVPGTSMHPAGLVRNDILAASVKNYQLKNFPAGMSERDCEGLSSFWDDLWGEIKDTHKQATGTLVGLVRGNQQQQPIGYESYLPAGLQPGGDVMPILLVGGALVGLVLLLKKKKRRG